MFLTLRANTPDEGRPRARRPPFEPQSSVRRMDGSPPSTHFHMGISSRRLALTLATVLGMGVLGSATQACSSDSCSALCGQAPWTGGAGAGGALSSGAGAGAASGGVATTSGSGSGGAASGSGGVNLGTAGSAGDNVGGASGGSSGASGASGGGGASGAGGVLPEVSSEGDGDIVIGPDYVKDPDLTDRGNKKGKRFSFSLSSQNSDYKGTDATLSKPWKPADKTVFTRNITVYVPDQYQDGREAPILVIQEGQIDNVSRALDNLTIATDPMKKLPAFIAIAVANGSDRDGADGQGSERGLEYDTLSDRYAKFIDTEVLPAVLANAEIKQAYPNLKLTNDPEGRGTMGCSSGGAAALSMGWFATDSFHRIITYSGTFVDQQNHSQAEAKAYPFGAWEYHSSKELIKNTEKKPLRIFLHASEQDLGYMDDEAGHHNWVMANQRTAAALKAKGYHYRFVFSKATGHCDGAVFNATLAQTLSWVWRGYPTP
jgi:iron(III)-enterobactin esterase